MVVDLNLDPSIGSETGKIRPCIVVTNDGYNEHVPVIQVTPLTAWNDKKARIVTNVSVEPSRQWAHKTIDRRLSTNTSGGLCKAYGENSRHFE